MKLIRTLLLTALFASPLLAADAPALENFAVDKSHSSVEFRIRHIISNVTGRFNDFDAAIDIDRANPAASSVAFTIQAASIDTANENRDKHLRNPDFFDVEKFPTITFKSTAIKPSGKKDVYDVTGDFTMHGVTKRITLPVEFTGWAKDQRGNERAGFNIETVIDRKDYGVTWNRALDQGGAVLGDEVKVSISLATVKKKQ